MNPWSVGSLKEFLFYCCPECNSKNSSEKSFLSHAISEHPHSTEYILKFNVEQGKNSHEIIVPDVKEGITNQAVVKIQIVKQEQESHMMDDNLSSMIKVKTEILADDEEEFGIGEDHVNTESADYESYEYEMDPTYFLDKDNEEPAENVPKSKKKNLTCKHYGKSLKSYAYLKRHILQFHLNDINEKSIDPTYFLDKDNEEPAEEVPKSKEKNLPCEHCGKSFKKYLYLKRHKLEFHPNVPEVHEKSNERKDCEHCQKSIALSHYEMHVNTQHMGYKPYKCKRCDKSYGSKYHLINHEKVIHNNERFQCDECGKSFTTNQTLRHHVQVQHEGIPLDRKYKCDKCDRSFTSAFILKSHKRIDHDKILAFSCDLCGKQFTRQTGLKSHIKLVHNDQRNYDCRFCEKSFKGKSAVENHEKGVHLKIKDIKCYVCSQMFSRYHHLQNHLDKIHNIKVSYKEMKEKLDSEKRESFPDSPVNFSGCNEESE